MKHTPNYDANVEVPLDIIEKFRYDAEKIASLEQVYTDLKYEIPKTEAEKNNIIQGYMMASILMYKKNNGIPPIPFPVSFSTCDMACWSFVKGKYVILLGRKPGQTQFQFPGGFRDPKETSQQAAKRELFEETFLDLDIKRFEFIQDLFIDDIRYKHSPHKVTTSIFNIRLNEKEMISAKGGDDLDEVKWFDMNELMKDSSIIRNIHLPIFEILWKCLLGMPSKANHH